MFLITSGAYIEQEFISEIGALPPSFLPLGNRCLFEHQILLAKLHERRIFLSVPESFELGDLDQKIVESNAVNLIPVPDGLSLGESIRYCIEQSGCLGEPLQILHGDTLFRSLPIGPDMLTISPNTGYYQRAVICEEPYGDLLETRRAVDNELVVSGYFSFADARLLSQLLEQYQDKFITAINQYHRRRTLTTFLANDWYDMFC